MADPTVLREALFSTLKGLGIETQTIEHPPAPTCDEHTKHVSHVEGGQAKNLCLKDKKGKMYLISVMKDTEVDLKKISARLGVPASAPMRMATPEKMMEALQVAPGSVTPFAVMSSSAAAVHLLLDTKFLEHKVLKFHPFMNTATTLISPADLDRFLASLDRKPLYVDFDDSASLVADAAATLPGGASAAPAADKAKKDDKPKKEPKAPKENKDEKKPTPPPTPPREPAAAMVAAPEAPERDTKGLSSDQWATGEYGRPCGKLETLAWSQTIWAKPEGWPDALAVPACGRASGPLTTVSWESSIFAKPVGW